MKRACFILIATLVVLLVYPASMPSAKSPSIDDTPNIITPHTGQFPDEPSGSGDGDGDSGDADDLGLRNYGRGDLPPVSAFQQTRFGAKIWWMYLLFHGIF